MKKVLVGMSGGVDSSMAAALLKEAGYEAEGLSLVLFDPEGPKGPRAPAQKGTRTNTCCSIETIGSAALTARKLSIPHHVFDAREIFRRKVIEPFVDAYSKGLTPNPCILCNRYVKFPILFEEAGKRGMDFIATGHYARIERSGGRAVLKSAIDAGKDQSYVLYMLDERELDSIYLPLGDYEKKEVRRLARDMGLPAATRPESQEICFIGDGRYADFMGSSITATDGPIIDDKGREIGIHRGIYRYTVGQRKGLGISSPRPLYVTKIDVEANAIHVGPREAAMIKEFNVTDINWLMDVDVGGARSPFRASVKVRSMMEARPARVLKAKDKDRDRVHVIYDEPQWAPAPGQSAVFYDGDTVLGGGAIDPPYIR